MKKILLFYSVFYLSISIYSQEKVFSYTNDLKKSISSIKDVIPIVNQKNDEIVYFISDVKNIYGYKINSEFEVIDKITSEEKRRKFKTLIGYGINDNDDYILYLSNKNHSNFLSVTFSFKENKTTSKEFKLPDSERFVQTVTLDNEFYLLSISKTSNEMYAYTFDSGVSKKKNLNTKNLVFLNSINSNTNLSQIFLFADNLKKIEENTPNSIDVSASNKKMFIKDNGVIFTFNDNKSFTQILDIDLKNGVSSSKRINNPIPKKKSNSYINGDFVFTISVSSKKFAFEVLDYKLNKVIKRYEVLRDDIIPFKNSPIIQKGGAFENYRELETTSQFVRKIKSGKVGMSVRKINNGYEIIMGGYVVKRSSGMMMPGGFGGFPIASFGNATIFFNPVQMAYGSYSNSKAIIIECLFNEDFKHLEGDISTNAFKKMNAFKDEKRKTTKLPKKGSMKKSTPPPSSENTSGSTVFRYKNYYLKTDYLNSTKTFSFKKFTD